MQIKFKIEATSEEGKTFSSSGPAEFPENKDQAETYTLDGETLDEVMKKAIVMVAMITAAAGNDTKLPEMFAKDKETIILPNPFHQV